MTDPSAGFSPPVAAAPPGSPADRLFRTEQLRGDLKSRSVRSGTLVMASQATQFLMGMASMMVLARLLGPYPFGVLAMAGTLTLFVFSFREFGFGMATVQAREITHRQASHLFWLNLKLQLLIAAGMLAAAPLLAWFYREPDLAAIVPILAGGILFAGTANIHRAVLRRQMRFGSLTALDVSKEAAGIAVALSLALAGFVHGLGVWALTMQQLTISLIEGFGLLLLARWAPAGHAGRAGRQDPVVQRMVSYSRHYTPARVVEHLSGNVDQVLVGRFAGADALGLYAKAFQWAVLPVKQVYFPLQHVVVAGGSRLLDNPPKYRAFMRKGFLATYSLVLPALAFLCVTGRDFILVLLGERWLDAVPIFRVLVLGSFVGAMGHLTRWVYFSEGRSKPQLQWMKLQAPAMVVAAAIGIYWGPLGVAWAIATAMAVLTYPNVRHCLRESKLRPRDFWGAAMRPAALSIAAAAAVWALQAVWLDGEPILVRVAGSAAAFAACYFGGWFVIPGGRDDFALLWDMFRTVMGRKDA